MLANQIRPTTLSAAIVFRVYPFLAKKHRELPFLAVAPQKGWLLGADKRVNDTVTRRAALVRVAVWIWRSQLRVGPRGWDSLGEKMIVRLRLVLLSICVL